MRLLLWLRRLAFGPWSGCWCNRSSGCFRRGRPSGGLVWTVLVSGETPCCRWAPTMVLRRLGFLIFRRALGACLSGPTADPREFSALGSLPFNLRFWNAIACFWAWLPWFGLGTLSSVSAALTPPCDNPCSSLRASYWWPRPFPFWWFCLWSIHNPSKSYSTCYCLGSADIAGPWSRAMRPEFLAVLWRTFGPLTALSWRHSTFGRICSRPEMVLLTTCAIWAALPSANRHFSSPGWPTSHALAATPTVRPHCC